MISLKKKKQFAQLESILNQLFEAAYGVEPDFSLMIKGCQNYYLPAITKGLDRITSLFADELPLAQRGHLMNARVAMVENDLSDAVYHADQAALYSQSIGFSSLRSIA